MRTALLALVLAVGCTQPDPPPQQWSPGGGGGGYGGGGGGGGGGEEPGCHADTDCGSGLVCARDGECLEAGDVITVHTTWTLDGSAASASTCSGNPDLEIDFSDDSGYGYGYAPVPCVEGEFTVDKLPNYYNAVSLSIAYDPGSGASAAIEDGGGTVSIDLPF
ncbi:MAG TPA: hypothetical protein VLX92_28235 [Kofleriaceae bacterium]|nr:hypothetical protein [Kofleriaceae bacterium]